MKSFVIATLLSALPLSAAVQEPAKKNNESHACPHCCLSKKAFTNVAKKATSAVVFIKVEMPAPEMDQFGFDNTPFGDEFFRHFFGAPPNGRQQSPSPQMGQGSGFFVSADGFVMTNSHVVKDAEKIEVTLDDGEILPAKLIGADPYTDVAIIKVEKREGKDFSFLKLGDSEELEVGEWVLAIGSPFQLQASVTAGIVSAKGRQNLNITTLEDFIQTDAAINPGNSGGPLLDLDGNVIGINTAIVSKSGGYMGIGFAIPSNMARNVMDQLINKGSITRGYLGVMPQPVDRDIAAAFNLEKSEGVLIASVEKGSPAEKAGIETGDIILEYNNKVVKSLQTFRFDISMMLPGSTVNLKVLRKGKITMIPVTLGTNKEGTNAPIVTSQKLGIEVDNLNPELARQLGYTASEEGVVITKVKPGSPAGMAGLRPGFLIQAVNHKKVSNTDDYEAAMGEASQNKRVLLLVRHGKMTRFYSIRVE